MQFLGAAPHLHRAGQRRCGRVFLLLARGQGRPGTWWGALYLARSCSAKATRSPGWQALSWVSFREAQGCKRPRGSCFNILTRCQGNRGTERALYNQAKVQ